MTLEDLVLIQLALEKDFIESIDVSLTLEIELFRPFPTSLLSSGCLLLIESSRSILALVSGHLVKIILCL